MTGETSACLPRSTSESTPSTPHVDQRRAATVSLTARGSAESCVFFVLSPSLRVLWRYRIEFSMVVVGNKQSSLVLHHKNVKSPSAHVHDLILSDAHVFLHKKTNDPPFDDVLANLVLQDCLETRV